MRKRIGALILTMAMLVSVFPTSVFASLTEESKQWNETLFTDVTPAHWFYSSVQDVYQLGLMSGYGNGLFQPEGSVTLAETVTIAANIHATAADQKDTIAKTNPWYDGYVQYALANGILEEALADYSRAATRLEFAQIMANALPAEDLAAVRDVPYGAIPDVKDDAAVYLLYRAGVLSGSDEKGTFYPDSNIKRSEVAAVAVHMALPETRSEEDIFCTDYRDGEGYLPNPNAKPTPDRDEDRDDEDEDDDDDHTSGGSGSGGFPFPFPTPGGDKDATVVVVVDDQGKVAQDATIEKDGSDVKATVPTGVAVENGKTRLTLTVSPLDSTDSSVDVDDEEEASSYDVHVDGVSPDNEVAILVALGKILPNGMNLGNVTLYHIEESGSNAMTQVDTMDALDAHNEFYYDPVTGEVTVAMATFSEIAVVADEESKWEGKYDYTWYDASKTELTIANADQLAAFGAIVGGMDSQTQDSFSGKTVKLLADVNLGDDEENNDEDKIFYPIGYYNTDGTYEKTGTAITSGFNTFEGTFDGNGHTIANFYQNTWEMKGDNNYYDASLQYYRDGMGLFGKVYGGTVKNLTVDNFSSDGEYTTTGVIAAYADGATFENIAITNCNPRVYNIGNGGIVGCVGWYAKDADLKTTFTNITVDNSNKISALWGSYDVACGGLVGQYYPTSGQTSAGSPKNAGIHMENCHVSAQIDVYNDVCANYQYYAYRYAGMMIGSIRENETIDGHVYPKMDGISASGCTVHFGTWNDYYYCELVDNTTASYTHDYQMSRLVEIKAINGTAITYLDGTTGTVPATGRANYVIVDYTKGHGTENAACYHFLNGEVWTHDMGGIQTGIDENSDGQDDLKEDKQHIYLEFNNLFTGYGWGVTSKGITDYAEEQIKILDRVVADSVAKFNKADTAKDSYTTGTTVTISELFVGVSTLEDAVAIQDKNVQVTVSPVGEDSTADGTYTANTTDWTQGTLTFSGTGAATITITDYYFCKPTTINVTITEKVEAEKFETKFTGDFLYRVGNQNAVKLDSLFKAKSGAEIGDVDVTVETVDGASGTYTPNATWTNGTIQFSGTGVVKVTVTDNDYCTPTELYLEVIDATNITSATGTTTGGDLVLLCDVNTSAYVYYWNCTLYGNGFTYSLNGAPTTYSSSHGHGVIMTKNAMLDNLVIVGDVYDEYGAYTNNNDYNAAIDVQGDTVIQNCYISGCSAPISTRANTTITNTTLYGGAVANLLIKGGTVTLENVTTANYNDGRNAPIGMGIVIHSDATESAKLVLNGTLTQYNFLNEEDTPTDTYAKNLHSAMFGTSLSKYHFGTSPNRRVNTGVVSLTATFNGEDITDNANTGYSGSSVTLSGVNGYVYTQLNTSGSVNNGYDMDTDPHVSTTQGAVPPSYSFDHTMNDVAKTDGSNDYCYEENGVVNISMDEGDTFNWATSILTLGKGLEDYTVSMNGTDYTGKSIAFNTAGDYEVVYTYTDGNNYCLDENGNITTYSVTYTKKVNITVAVIEASAKNAEFTMGSSNAATEKITIDNTTYISATGVTADNSTWTYITIDGQKIYYPIVAAKLTSTKGSSTYAYFPVFENVVTIKDYADNGTGDAFTYNSSTTDALHTALPTAVKGIYKAASDVSYWYNLTNSNLTQSGASKIFKWASSSDASSDATTYNNVLCYKSPQISADRVAYITLVQYSYTDATNTTYYYYVGYTLEAFTKQTTCVTPDTLVTMADGTQKRIDEATYEDEFLVWDFVNGEYTTASASIVMNHGFWNATVVTLYFEDGTEISTIDGHGFFDAAANKYILLDVRNVADYVGHSFIKQDGESYSTVKLVDYSVSVEETEVWSILTAEHYNCILEGMFTLTPAEVEGSPDYLMPFVVGDDMKYDEAAMMADIETYGLYTYEEFAEYMTYEQFMALNLPIFKVAVGKGYITYDEIMYLIGIHIQP